MSLSGDRDLRVFSVCKVPSILSDSDREAMTTFNSTFGVLVLATGFISHPGVIMNVLDSFPDLIQQGAGFVTPKRTQKHSREFWMNEPVFPALWPDLSSRVRVLVSSLYNHFQKEMMISAVWRHYSVERSMGSEIPWHQDKDLVKDGGHIHDCTVVVELFKTEGLSSVIHYRKFGGEGFRGVHRYNHDGLAFNNKELEHMVSMWGREPYSYRDILILNIDFKV